jgi:putative acetyltransferase
LVIYFPFFLSMRQVELRRGNGPLASCCLLLFDWPIPGYRNNSWINLSMITVREELPEDAEPIRELTVSAFANSPLGYHGEANLIESLREARLKRLSLVAVSNHQMLGHVMFSTAIIRTPDRVMTGMGLAPLSVAPDHQRRGVGSLLVQSGLEGLFSAGCSFVIVLGHPEYYPRFGFQPAMDMSISHGFQGISQCSFFLLLNPGLDSVPWKSGLAFYADEFGAQHT